jgi:hypothetical protein
MIFLSRISMKSLLLQNILDLHEKRARGKEHEVHLNTSAIPNDLENKSTTHSNCEAMSAIEHPKDDLCYQESPENRCEGKVAAVSRNISKNRIIERTKFWGAL